MELTVQKRNKFGKAARELRKEGLIPAELYGKGIKNEHLAVPVKDFRKVFKEAGESTMINVLIDGEKRPAIIADVATDPVTDELLNIDFYQVRLDEKIRVKIPVDFIGEAPAVKEKAGVLVKAMQELEVEALPSNIPHSVQVDLSRLADIGNSIAVKDLAVGGDIKVLADANAVLVTVTAQMTEEEEAKLSAEVKPEDIKTEGEEKKAEKEAAKAEAGEVPPAGKPAGEKKEEKK